LRSKTLIFGNGPCAHTLARNLLAEGFGIVLTSAGKIAPLPSDLRKTSDKCLEIVSEADIVACHGSVGKFEIRLKCRDRSLIQRAAHIILAADYFRTPNFSVYELTPSAYVLSTSQLSDRLSSLPENENLSLSGKKIIFLSGIAAESNPIVAEEVMRLAGKLQTTFNAQVYIFTKNLKVAGNGLESLYRTTTDAGVIYNRLTDTMPLIRQKSNSGVQIEFVDELLPQGFKLAADLTVVDESIHPARCLKPVSDLMGLEIDPAGFVQAENVHRGSNLTNRKGVFTVGPARGIMSRADQIDDAGGAAVSLLVLRDRNGVETADTAEIDSAKCIRCLTCLRLCPHRAVVLASEMTVDPDACEGCGICAAECPRKAIQIKGSGLPDMIDSIRHHRPATAPDEYIPFLVAFICRRSAGEARALAARMGYVMPRNLIFIEVPCAGAISLDDIYTAFAQKADGVLVLACHKDNCHSQKGNLLAIGKVHRVTDFFQQMGAEPKRLIVSTIASNMGSEFAETLHRFKNQIYKLGPSRLNR